MTIPQPSLAPVDVVRATFSDGSVAWLRPETLVWWHYGRLPCERRRISVREAYLLGRLNVEVSAHGLDQSVTLETSAARATRYETECLAWRAASADAAVADTEPPPAPSQPPTRREGSIRPDVEGA